MIRECFDTKTGILFKAVKLRTAGLEPATLYPKVIKRNGAYNTTGRRIRAPETTAQVKKRHRDTWKPYEDFQRQRRATPENLRCAQADGPLPHGQVAIPNEITERGDVFHYMVCHNECIDDPNKPVNEDDQDLGDCLAPHYDQYELKWWWKVLEFRFFRDLIWGRLVIVIPLKLDASDRFSFLVSLVRVKEG